MYCQYWGLQKPAFDNVPDPSMFVDCHASMESAIAETLFAIEEGDECIAVIIGDVGLGKTLSIRMIIDLLDPENYKIVLITNPGISFVQILQEIIGQLTDKQCEEKRKVKLLETFNHLLFSTCDEGKKILIFIDEANAISPMNLESLRLLTNMQSDKRNLFTMVLAGQLEFAKRLEHPKRANLLQRVGTYSRIDKLGSAGVVRKYVETRLMLAGSTKKIFTDDAFDKIWEHSDYGVPRLINKLSKLCLKAGETNNLAVINEEVVEQIGSRFHMLTGPAMPKRRPRKRVQEEERLCIAEDLDEQAGDGNPINQAEESVRLDEEREQNHLPADSGEISARENEAASEQDCNEPEQSRTGNEAEIRIGNLNVSVKFPENLLKQSLSYSAEHRYKMAGVLAAETLKNNPQLITAHFADPVPIWQEIRDFVIKRITPDQQTPIMSAEATGS